MPPGHPPGGEEARPRRSLSGTGLLLQVLSSAWPLPCCQMKASAAHLVWEKSGTRHADVWWETGMCVSCLSLPSFPNIQTDLSPPESSGPPGAGADEGRAPALPRSLSGEGAHLAGLQTVPVGMAGLKGALQERSPGRGCSLGTWQCGGQVGTAASVLLIAYGCRCHLFTSFSAGLI